MYNSTNNRTRPNQRYARSRFNAQANTTKRINKSFNKRGGIKL